MHYHETYQQFQKRETWRKRRAALYELQGLIFAHAALFTAALALAGGAFQ